MKQGFAPLSQIHMSDSCLVKQWGHVLRGVALLLVLSLWSHSVPATAAPVETRQLTADLGTAVDTLVPGKPLTVALKLNHKPTWHTYWINPGDAGFPISIQWELPPGFQAGKLQFPYPHLFDGQGLVGYGYEGETLLFTEITPPVDLSDATVTLKAKANWLACDPATCVPGSAALELTLPVGTTSKPSADASLINRGLLRLPIPDQTINLVASDEGESISLTIHLPKGTNFDPKRLYFFPETKGLISASTPQTFTATPEGAHLTVPKAKAKAKPAAELPDPITGVIVGLAGGHQTYRISTDPAVLASAAPSSASATRNQQPGTRNLTLLTALLFSFLGGIVLNIMPCVFPVISLKVMGFVNQAGESRKHILYHGLVFAAGVLVFFWILAAVILSVRAGGNIAGWGHQLQQPGFVMGMAVLMLLIALNLFGVFEFGTSMTGVGGKLISGTGLSGSFWNGALATLLATPCTGPFMATALGYAVGKPAIVSILIFTFLGLGMATPYILLSAFPGLIQKLPRPGPWMETFKQIMGFPMLAVVLWLTVVLSAQLSHDGLLLFLGAILIISFALWIYGRFATPVSKKKSLVRFATIALLLAAFFTSAKATHLRAPLTSTDIADIISTHRAAGKNVFVDFTAIWCATCQANKPSLHAKSVEEALEKHKVEFVIADYTNNDERITKFLQAHGRDGVPFYPLFPADPKADPIILPQTLTPGVIIKHLEKLP